MVGNIHQQNEGVLLYVAAGLNHRQTYLAAIDVLQIIQVCRFLKTVTVVARSPDLATGPTVSQVSLLRGL